MENNTLLNPAQYSGSEELLKVTALLYFKEALVAQEYESCPELVSAAKSAGASQNEVSAVITEYLENDTPPQPVRQKGGRKRPY